jgi:hypothetical protein
MTLFGAVAVTVAVVAISSAMRQDDAHVPLRTNVWRVLSSSVIVGTAGVSLIGMWMMLGAWALLLAGVLAAGSPYAVRSYVDWRNRRSGKPTESPELPLQGETTSSDIEDTSELAVDLHSLSDAAVCQAWRLSFSDLQGSSSLRQRIHIVESRRRYLDELERRNPEGLMAWLASGARAGSNPSKFITGSTGISQRSIDWDELIPRQDR